MNSNTIVIAPFSRKLRNGNENPKNYPWWDDLIYRLQKKGYSVVQIGTSGEKKLVDDFRSNLSIGDISNLILSSKTWISVDNFLPHLCHLLNKPGIVIWGKSDPNIFGYSENINLLKDRKFLRHYQFDVWEAENVDSNVFLKPEEVIEKCQILL